MKKSNEALREAQDQAIRRRQLLESGQIRLAPEKRKAVGPQKDRGEEVAMAEREAPTLVGIGTASAALGLGESTLRRWIREGRLPIVRLGRRVLIRREVLDALVARGEQSGRERQAGAQ